MDRFITILPSIVLTDIDGVTPLKIDANGEPQATPHVDFLLAKSRDAVFGISGVDGIVCCAELRSALQDKKVGEVLRLHEATWNFLVLAIREPRLIQETGAVAPNPWDPLRAPQLLPFIRSVLDATSTPPEAAPQ